MITMTEETPIAAIPIGEWINRGKPKNTWFKIIHRLCFDIINRDEINSCVMSVKKELKTYGRCEIREPDITFNWFDTYEDYFINSDEVFEDRKGDEPALVLGGVRSYNNCFIATCEVTKDNKYCLYMCTEARIIE